LIDNYTGFVTSIKNVRAHTNADRLQVGEVFHNQVIVGLDWKEGDIGIYFPSGSQLGVEYCKENSLLRSQGGYLDDDKRHVVAVKLRKEISDGLFMPLSSLEGFTDVSSLKVGDIITVLNGLIICEKYVPKTTERKYSFEKGKNEKKKSEYPLFSEHLDTAQLAYNMARFRPGDICVITLKMHGTSGRSSHTFRVLPPKTGLVQKIRCFIGCKILGFSALPTARTWECVCGSRRVILDEKADGGFYGTNDFRFKHHQKFVICLPKGMTVFYEIVGYVSPDKPIMADGNNKKVDDKGFVALYGEKTRFSYGCEDGESELYVYRITMTNEDGYEYELSWDAVKLQCDKMGVKHVPELERFVFTTEEDLLSRIEKYLDVPDPVGKTHVTEGVVIRIENSAQFEAYKHKGNLFKILEGIITSDAVKPDMEEDA